MHQIADILGYAPDKEPASSLLYQAAAVRRLVQNV